MEGDMLDHLAMTMKDVRSHLGLRISNFAPKKPSNVRMIAKEYSRVNGFASSLEH
jgi:hypothetical protein